MRINGISEGSLHSELDSKREILLFSWDSLVTYMMSYMRALSLFNRGDSTEVVVRRKERGACENSVLAPVLQASF